MNKPNVLFLADTTHPAGAVKDHILAVTSSSTINWHVINPLISKTIDKINFDLFDAIGIHYSIKPYNNYYLSAQLKKKISEYQGVKFLFLQDEYQRVNQVQEYLAWLKFDLLFTLVKPDTVDIAYPDSRLADLKKVTVLTGYVQDEMKHYENPAISERKIDVSYRGRRCDYWLGSLAYEKEYIAEQFVLKTKDYKLKTDISIEEKDRVYGENWLKLLQNSRAVLGTESGASIWDFDRDIERKTHQYLAKNRGAEFAEVYEKVLKPFDGKIMYNAISPRVFEAVATKTPMIMFPGEYSNVCLPDEHYIVLEKDFSNINEVVEKLKDTDFLSELADRAFNDLILSDKYSQHGFSELIADELLALIKRVNKHSQQFIQDEMNAHIYKYRFLNSARRMTTELMFSLRNFVSLLTDNRFSFKERMKQIAKGGQRYFVYLMARTKD